MYFRGRAAGIHLEIPCGVTRVMDDAKTFVLKDEAMSTAKRVSRRTGCREDKHRFGSAKLTDPRPVKGVGGILEARKGDYNDQPC